MSTVSMSAMKCGAELEKSLGRGRGNLRADRKAEDQARRIGGREKSIDWRGFAKGSCRWSEQMVALDPKSPRTQLSRLHGASKGCWGRGGGARGGLVIAGISEGKVVCASKIEVGNESRRGEATSTISSSWALGGGSETEVDIPRRRSARAPLELRFWRRWWIPY